MSRLITDVKTDILTSLVQHFSNITQETTQSGYAYVLGRVSALLTEDQWKEIATWLTPN
jgi:hypothetical protein